MFSLDTVSEIIKFLSTFLIVSETGIAHYARFVLFSKVLLINDKIS